MNSENNSERLNPAIGKWINSLNHPQESSINWVRKMIIKTTPAIEENIKWNSPNFSVNGLDRITLRIQPIQHFQIILHLGAKKSTENLTSELTVKSSLIEWKTKDRGIITLSGRNDLNLIETELRMIVSTWLNLP